MMCLSTLHNRGNELNGFYAKLQHNIFYGGFDARNSDLMAHLMHYTWPANVILDKGAGIHVPYHRTVLFAPCVCKSQI